MSVIRSWEHFFKPEVRASGRRLASAGKISSRQVSDTEVQAFVKDSSGFKVIWKSLGVENPNLEVKCSCPSFARGQFCKHIWATLLKIESTHSDLLEGKTELHLIQDTQNFSPRSRMKTSVKTSRVGIENQEDYKLKQKAYRKQAYEKQKQRAKDFKAASKKRDVPPPQRPKTLEKAFLYFSENGFPIDENVSLEKLAFIKKKLSKVFHPDLGGSHDEILELNRNLNEVMQFLGLKN